MFGCRSGYVIRVGICASQLASVYTVPRTHRNQGRLPNILLAFGSLSAAIALHQHLLQINPASMHDLVHPVDQRGCLPVI